MPTDNFCAKEARAARATQKLATKERNMEAYRMGTARTPAGSFPFALRLNDVVSGYIQSEGFWEINHPQLLAGLAPGVLRERGTFLDVGGNLGWHAFLFAYYNYSVVTVEAMPSNQRAIELTACANPQLAARITLVKSALVAPGPPQPCYVSTLVNNSGNGQLVCAAEASAACADRGGGGGGGGGGCERVSTQTLDALLGRLTLVEPIVAVKLDIEGAECDVLNGGSALFSRHRPPFVQIEGRNPKVADTIEYREGGARPPTQHPTAGFRSYTLPYTIGHRRFHPV